MAVKFIPEQEWLISVSRDKTFQFYCTKTGRKLGNYEAQAWCLAVEYPFTLQGQLHNYVQMYRHQNTHYSEYKMNKCVKSSDLPM